ncbi:hypothetical protein [Streptomyces sp. MI02-7b]|nr:hypothetical protein [Streptomyces sp. MI02-7b]MDX3078501.1 hypothetical protein [Streptomyces sp. MI02-7b]
MTLPAGARYVSKTRLVLGLLDQLTGQRQQAGEGDEVASPAGGSWRAA